MPYLTRDDLYTLEEYARVRPEFRARVIAHKQDRKLPLGEHMTLYFEDRLTMQYQVQEMLRIERIFEPQGIEDELAAYNPLIPDGSNWKATLMIEYADPDERGCQLARLVGVEHTVWVQVSGFDRVFAKANEDLERSTGEKTSSVHFLRFELSPPMAAAVKRGAAVAAGVAHERARIEVGPLPERVRASLALDLVAAG